MPRPMPLLAAALSLTWVLSAGSAVAQHLDVTVFGGAAFPVFDGRLAVRATGVPPLPGYDVTASGVPELRLDGGGAFGTAVALDFGLLGIEGRWDGTYAGFDAMGARYDVRSSGAASPSLAGSVTLGNGRFDLDRLNLLSINLRVRTPGLVGFTASGGLSYLPDIRITGSVPVSAEILGLPVLPALQPRVGLVATPGQSAHRWGVNGGAGIRVGGRLSVVAEARVFYFGKYDLHFVMDDALPLVSDFVSGIGVVDFHPIVVNAQAGVSFRF
jgi:hypothetical protein